MPFWAISTVPESEGEALFVAQVIDRWPTPPRAIGVGQLVRHFSWRSLTPWIPYIMVMVVGMVVPSLVGASLGMRLAVGLIATSALALALGGIGVYFARYRAAVRTGIRTRATVLEVRFEIDETGDETEDWEKSEAVGTYEVEHPHGRFREEFSLFAPWAVDLRAGDVVTVVVHHSKRKVFLNLGVETSPVATPSPPRSHSTWHPAVERSRSGS